MSSYGGVGKQLKVLFYDFGLGLTHALRMAEDGNLIKYFSPWASSYPNFKEYAPGLGYEKQGLEKVMKFFPHVEWADLIVCVDVGAGDLLDYLRKQGKICFGSSDKGDELENNREFVRKLQEKIGLPVQKTDVIKGIPALREFLKKHPEKYVKLDIFRADMESFYAKNYDEVEIYLDNLEVCLGPFNETYNFMVEDKIEGFEPGFDLFFTNGDWLKPMLWGIEQSKECFDKDTEVLTNKGWKFFKDLDRTEEILTLNLSNRKHSFMEYQKPIKYMEYDFDGEMIKIDNQQFDTVITPNHKLLVSSNNKVGYGVRGLHLIEAEKIYGESFRMQTPKTLLKTNCKRDSWFNLDGIKINKKNWIKFLAIYLAEGYTRKEPRNEVFVSQEKYQDEVWEILRVLPFKFNRYKNGFSCHSKVLADYLRQFGKSRDKFIPNYVKFSSQSQIEEFLYVYCLGDGHWKPNNSRSYTTNSKKMADDIQELIAKIGRTGIVYPIKNRDIFRINERITKIDGSVKKQHMSKVYYNDKVYCVTVPNHIIYVRRNGKPMWSGNSYVGAYMDHLPKPLEEIGDKLKKVLTKIDYRGALSIEVRLTKEKVPYLIDICSRYPFPLSAGYTHSIKNYSEVIWKIANKEQVKIQTKGKYFVNMPLYSSAAEENYVLVDIPKEVKEHVKVRTSAIVKGKTYAIKGTKVIANIATCGNDYKKLILLTEKIAEKVSAFNISTEALASLHAIEEKIAETKKFDLTGF